MASLGALTMPCAILINATDMDMILHVPQGIQELSAMVMPGDTAKDGISNQEAIEEDHLDKQEVVLMVVHKMNID
jgi:hypothetical protein